MGAHITIYWYETRRNGSPYLVRCGFEHNEIHVHTAKESGSRDVKGPKTSSGIRDIPIHSDLGWRLKEAKGEPFALVFPNQNGVIQTESAMRRAWKSFRKELGTLGPVSRI